MATDPNDVIEAVAVTAMRKARQRAASSGHRHLLLFAGETRWCRDSALAAVREVASSAVLWVTEAVPEGSHGVAASHAGRELGQEWEVVVFDAFSGFDTNAFGAVSGTVRGGGVLLLLTPPLVDWPRSTLEETPEGGSRFIARFVRLLEDAEGVTIVQQGRGAPLPVAKAVSPPQRRPSVDSVCRTEDQRQAVEAVLRVAHGHRRRPLVLMSNRGRGKSAALGIAAARLLVGGRRRILVTAPSYDTTRPLFQHAARLLPDARHHRKGLYSGSGELLFVAPDVLLRSAIEADLLLVDEAAAIPPSLLKGLLRRYARIVFATTVHGYEGSGRGFEVRFHRHLDSEAPGWRLLQLDTPIRWAPEDPLERLVFDTLLLDAEPAPDDQLQGLQEEEVVFTPLSQETLAADERLLRQVFGLLLLAHYRTTPNDLRQLLDRPGLETFVLRWNEEVAAVALVAEEGDLAPPLATAIRAGRRRVRGHLLPQSLLAHLGLAEAGGLRYLRVVRVAVHPAVRRLGLGRRLLDELQGYSENNRRDCIGASFGASPELLNFWQRAGYDAVRVGVSRGARSGAPSVMVLRALSPQGRELLEMARERFHADFAHQLAAPLADIDPALAVMLLRQEAPVAHDIPPSDAEMLAAFAYALRPFEQAIGALWRLVCMGLPGPGPRVESLDALLLAAVLQHRSWGELAAIVGSSGRREVVKALRQAVREQLESVENDAVTAAIRNLKQERVEEGLVGSVIGNDTE